jgi:TP901 family phage tail tape measure protein
MDKRFSIDAIFRAVDRMSAPVAKMNANLMRFATTHEKSFKALDGALGKVHSTIARTATATAAAATAAGYALVEAAKPGLDFEQQMANLGATSLQTRDQIADLEKEALRLGAATQFSATEAAAGMEQMAKAGFTNQEILEGISGMMYAAAAAGEDLATTTEHVSSVMKGMALPTTEATRVADVLALASVRTNSSISSLAESMSKASSTARQLRVPLEETVAMVALLQDVGIDASEAGSSVATMLTMMSKPTDEVKAKMKQLGVSFQDAKGNMLGPTKVLEQLVKAGKKAGGNMAQVAFFAELVGMRGQKAAVNLKDLFAAGKFTELTDELKKAQGVAEQMSNLRMDTTLGDLDKLQESIKTVLIDLFSLKSADLRKSVQKATEWIDKNKGRIIEEVMRRVQWLLENIPTIEKWVKRIGKMVVAFYAVAAAVKVATVSIQAYALASKLLGGGTAAVKATAVAAGLLNAEVLAANKGLVGMRAALNASAMAQALDTIQSKLGKAGVLGLALGVGVAFGTWLNHTFELDKKIADWIAELTGLADRLENRNGPKSVNDSDTMSFPDGTVMDREGNIKVRGPNWERYANQRLRRQEAAGDVVLSAAEQARIAALQAAENPSSVTWSDAPLAYLGDSVDLVQSGETDWRKQVVSPQERIAHTINESTTTTKAEVTIRDETGTATVTKQPTQQGWFQIQVTPSGAF